MNVLLLATEEYREAVSLVSGKPDKREESLARVSHMVRLVSYLISLLATTYLSYCCSI